MAGEGVGFVTSEDAIAVGQDACGLAWRGLHAVAAG